MIRCWENHPSDWESVIPIEEERFILVGRRVKQSNVKFVLSKFRVSGVAKAFYAEHGVWLTSLRTTFYYINLSELQGFVLLWKHDIFNDAICTIKLSKFNCWTNLHLFLYDKKHLRRLIGNIRQLSVIIEKWSEMFIWTSDSLPRIFKNRRKMFGNLREIAKISLILLFT